MVGSIPHAWLFSRMAAIVPSIVTPVLGDQSFWARRVSDMGVGPMSVPRRKLTVERLSGAIDAALSDEAIRTKSAILGEHIRAEDGVSTAVDLIEQWYETGR
jgi:UDP:flavonoid glycosyltransferase YjiC (YdhE family)